MGPAVGFLKIDVQGFEPDVLAGATETLKSCAGLQIEMALEASYVGQVLLPEVVKLVHDQGFRLVHLETGFSDPHTGYTLEVDGLFVRRRQDFGIQGIQHL